MSPRRSGDRARILTADNIHAAILIVGSYSIFVWAFEENVQIWLALGALFLWVLAYSGFIYVLLPRGLRP